MDNLTNEQQKELVDIFGELVIKKVRDSALKKGMAKATLKHTNPGKLKQYECLKELPELQQEAVCDLLSETITSTIYDFIKLFEENASLLEMNIKKDGNVYDIIKISEEPGSDICFYENGWIQRFSEIGRFVL